MINVKCPICKSRISIEEPGPDGVERCPECGKRFRLPTTRERKNSADSESVDRPAPPSKARRNPAPRPDDDDDDDQPYDLGETAPDPPEAPAAEDVRKRRPVRAEDSDVDDDDGEEEEESQRARAKKKKKKRRAPAPAKTNTNLIAFLVMAGFAIMTVVVAGVVYMVKTTGGDGGALPDQEPAVVALKAKQARFVRDENAPGKPVLEVDLSFSQLVTNGDLKHLEAFKQLRKLSVAGTLIGGIGMQYVESCTSLEVLDVGSTKLNDSGMDSIGKLTRLRKLSLRQDLVTDGGLEHLKACKNLEEINLEGTLASGAALAAALPKLQIVR